MSNAGQVAGAIVGGIIGFVASGFTPMGAMYGIQLGLLAGMALSPTELPRQFGPRMEDLQTTSAQVGAPVVRSWGTMAVPGTVMWLGAIEEVATTTEVDSGTFGPEQSVTSYSYYQSIAIGLVGNEISGIQRVWENGELMYDIRGQQDNETSEEFSERMEASRQWEGGVMLYTGTEDQMPDPTIEAEEGVGNVPAFRGLSYIVLTRRRLLESQGRRHPQYRFEIYDGDSEREYLPPTLLSEGVLDGISADIILPDWARGRYIVADSVGDEQGFREFRMSDNTELRQQSFEDALPGVPNHLGLWIHGTIAIGHGGHIYYPWFTASDNVSIARIDPDTLVMDVYRAEGYVAEFWREAVAIYLHGYGDFILSVSVSGHFSFYNGTNLSGSEFWTPGAGYTDGKVCRGSFYVDPPDFLTGRIYGYALAYDPASSGSSLPIIIRRVYARYNNLFARRVITGSEPYGAIEALEIDPTWTRIVDCRVFLWDEADRTMLIGVTGGASGSDSETSRFFKYDPATWTILWNVETTLPLPHDVLNSSRVQNNRIAWRTSLRNTRYFDTTDGSYEDIEWTEAFNSFTGEQVFDGGSNRMVTFEIGLGPVVLEFGNPSPEDVSLATIVSDVCNECGLSDADIDVTDLESRFVHGYARTRPMSGRACIEPLRMVGFFDCVESGNVLKWPTRGKAEVATIEADELGAHEGEDDVPAVTTRKLSGLELPRAIRVHYVAPSRDYEPGEQISPVRLITDAVNDVDVDLVAALDDDQAAQIAEIIWADAWRARWVHEISFDRYWSELEPADAVIVPVDGRNERMRIASLTTSDMILRRAELVRDDDGAYESTAVAEPPGRQPNRIRTFAGTELLMLDLPALREEDDDAGIYSVAGRTVLGNAWNGAAIYRSADAGVTWTQVGSVSDEATVGRIETPLEAGITGTWDYANSIDVVIPSGRTLENRSKVAVLAGANVAAIGVDGRWEVVQFVNAELIGTNRYRLTTLLRGRHGTEHLVGTSVIDDYFVLMTGPGIVRLPLATAQIEAAMLYRGVTAGTAFSSSISQSFTGHGMALETFSPVYVRGERDSSEDVTITWIRRDRLHQTMRSGVELPNSEASESYSIDILDGSSVVRTLTSSTPSVVYTAEDQTTDFGEPQAEVSVRIYQLSAIVGRGTPAEATI
jgi:hypothetical protein